MAMRDISLLRSCIVVRTSPARWPRIFAVVDATSRISLLSVSPSRQDPVEQLEIEL